MQSVMQAISFAAMKKVVSGASSLKDAITAYSEVVNRGAEEVLISKQTAIMILDWDQLMESPMVKTSLDK
jgi:hypothetical protein